MKIVSTQLLIGMEIHVELATNSKMFTSAPNGAIPERYDAEPNTLVNPLVMALPGSLPVINKSAVAMSMRVGLALNCTISSFTKWDRKNYYYPDLPKGYQISQFDKPLCLEGAIEIEVDGEIKPVRITRAHLEEDTGKLGHELPGGGHYDGSLVDLNRAGTPLLEIVSEPDMTTADEAVAYGKEIRAICRFLGVTEGILQRGHMRFEPNINVVITTEDGVEHPTPIVEVKNLNSFKALHGAIEHEAVRQIEAWKEDGLEMGPNAKSTRGWDDQNLVTVMQREKEDAHDYRFFPDPDLVPLTISQDWIDEVNESIPELPASKRARYKNEYSISTKDTEALIAEPTLSRFFETCVEASNDPSECAKWLLNAGAKEANEQGCRVDALGITPEQIAGIISLRGENKIGSSAAGTLFVKLCSSDQTAESLAESEGLLQVNDENTLATWVQEAIDAQPQAADDVRQGKDAAIGRLMGEVMKRSGGSADAGAVRKQLLATLRQ
ncbi:MAG TPA: Asp-tRNA(Asn)/Glu-tRNA(Gln) amidotransferase subunit GatB [Phycisphaerales bacterium]|nr:Asp-tRNA(Asn)/Glu-tRNA(Gln) amidotransferase subunit GatB [Phycisphaerales bacterium]HIO52156.1 Asp-tRNA(Asn)/Glu-tRNA(Gln) amidotransferase subunit GatB [Phycisphaerales bacterium]